ncbi:MAG: VWA domain-containing protein [Acidobacteriaceae bacterium]
MIRLRSFFCLASICLLPVHAALLVAQTAPAPATSSAAEQPATQLIPLFRTNANLVLVDVVVRDKGNPVHDLKAEDFRVFEDGREQKITVFEEHRATDEIEVGKAPADLPPNTWSDAPRYAVTSAANVLLLDALNTPLSDQVYVRRRMLQYLHTIPPGTRIAVFTLGSKLRIIEGFTTDSSAIEKALQGRGNPEKSPVMDPDWDQTLEEAANLPGGGLAQGAAMAQFAEETQSSENLLRADVAFDAMEQLARYLATVPGRKNVVWFSGSMPFNLTTGSSPNLDQMADLQDRAKKTMELLALARVALYPVDARGLMNAPSSAGDARVMNPNLFTSIQARGVSTSAAAPNSPGMSSPPSAGVAGQTVAQVVQQRDQAFLDQVAFDHLNMESFAKQTGGKAFINTNAVGKAVADAIADGSDYYTLAYAPENRDYNGAYRKVEVKLVENHYDLDYRRGYYAYNPATADKLMPGRVSPLIAAMQHGGLPLSQVPFQVRVVPSTDPVLAGEQLSPDPAGALAKTLKPPLIRYVADFTIDSAGLDARALPDGRNHNEVELTAVAYDVEGIRENYADGGFAVDGAPGQHLRLHQEIDLPAGKTYLRIGVHDLMSGRIGTVEIPLTVSTR